MDTVLKAQTDVVVILATGGGKSMLAIIPSLLETNKAMVLVLPLNSLIMDYEHRLQAMSVPYQVYRSNMALSPRENLILVSADTSQTTNWRTAISDLAHRKTIACIMIDEAHIPLIAKGYRSILQHFYDIRSEPVQLVLLSATIPPLFMTSL